VAHRDDLGPICAAVYENQELLPSIAAEINCKLLEWSNWLWFLDQWFLGVSWQVILTLLAGQDDVINIVVNSWPVNS